MSIDLPLFASLFFFSLYDIRRRTAPGIGFFLLVCVLAGLADDPLRVTVALLALLWSLFEGAAVWALPLLLHPSSWLVLLLGYGARRGVTNRADLYAATGLACVLPWQALIAACAGLELWRRWWARKDMPGNVPALPGLLLGVTAYLLARWWYFGV